MELFGFDQDTQKNLLPYGGTVKYYGRILSLDEAQMQEVLRDMQDGVLAVMPPVRARRIEADATQI